MTTEESRVTIHMVASLDGFIEKKDRSVSWMESSDIYENGVTLADEDVEEFLKTIDCYVMGARTYELALELGWPYGEIPVIVLTHRDLPAERDSVEIYAGDLHVLLNEKLKPKYRSIWLVGGAEVTREFIRLNLADDIRLTIIPVILGDGTPFFDNIGVERKLHLREATAYRNGMLGLWYEIKGA